MKEYNVILKKDVDYDGFWEDMETETSGLLYIPNRRIEFTNERPGSLRQCWYLLTDEEAEIVKQDSRVLSVEIPPEHREDIQIGLRRVQDGVFTKPTSDSGNFQNWGLIRSKSSTNIYGTSTTTSEKYVYNLDGSGVDIVIQDSGIQTDHPEFQDENGISRFVSVDWGVVHGGFSQSENHDRDFDGHGTHCAGIAAGKTFGWAKNVRIHHQKIAGLEGSGDLETGILPSYAFDAIKLWHNEKPIDPNTGFKRPTVVNMSWGYLTTYTSVSSINYRGTNYISGIDTANNRQINYGLMNSQFAPGPPITYMTNVRIESVDTDIEELVDAGVIVCIAAGNRAHKIDVPDGTDFNNNAVTNSGTKYYHRGSSPYGDAGYDGGSTGIIVGSMDSSVYSESQDYKATYSETGLGVDIYAPGTNIMSACSTTNRFGAPSYYGNASFKQTNISGTSMASPQVAGVAALLLQLNPGLTPTQVKQYLKTNCGTALYDTGNSGDWTNNRSLKGGSVKALFCGFDINKNTQQEPMIASGNFQTFFPFQLQKR